jgi:hypothetical protein
VRGTGILRDIDARGARLATGFPIAVGEPVWIGLVRLPGEWVKASVVAITKERGLPLYHLAFREECAPSLLEMASAEGGDPPSRGQPPTSWAIIDDGPAE